MPKSVLKVMKLGLLVLATAGCTPLVVGGAVVVADTIVEDREGGDGLF